MGGRGCLVTINMHTPSHHYAQTTTLSTLKMQLLMRILDDFKGSKPQNRPTRSRTVVLLARPHPLFHPLIIDMMSSKSTVVFVAERDSTCLCDHHEHNTSTDFKAVQRAWDEAARVGLQEHSLSHVLQTQNRKWYF